MLSQPLPTLPMLQVPNLAFFDHLYTLSNSKAKLFSSAVSSQQSAVSSQQSVFAHISVTADRSFIIAHPWQRQDQNQNGNQNVETLLALYGVNQ
jgi:hypothetical protein